jgi:hypothetical protein
MSDKKSLEPRMEFSREKEIITVETIWWTKILRHRVPRGRSKVRERTISLVITVAEGVQRIAIELLRQAE